MITSDMLWLVELNPSMRGFNLGMTAVEHNWYSPPCKSDRWYKKFLKDMLLTNDDRCKENI